MPSPLKSSETMFFYIQYNNFILIKMNMYVKSVISWFRFFLIIVPSAPDAIKAFASGTNKITVSWLPPKQKNGELTGYTIYMNTEDVRREDNQMDGQKRNVPESVTTYEINRLYESATYKFWVTASTKIGEGESTNSVSVLPTNKVAARIVSFGKEIITPFKRNLSLPCQKVGSARSSWKYKDNVVGHKDRFQISRDGTLRILEAQKGDSGDYTCFIENQYGKDEITYKVSVRVPPDPPELTVVNESTNSLSLTWKDTAQSDVPVLGYVINYKRDHGDWEELNIDSKTDTYELTNLWCGTKYQLYMTAYNKIGTGLPCDIVIAFTKGSAPSPPVLTQQGITYNATEASVWLDTWNDGGCPILYFVAECKTAVDTEWVVASKPISPADRVHTISSLKPGIEYRVRLTAHNNVGSGVRIYNFTTPSNHDDDDVDDDGEDVDRNGSVEFRTASPESVGEEYFTSVTSLVSVGVLAVILAGVAATICYIKVKSGDDDVAANAAAAAAAADVIQEVNKRGGKGKADHRSEKTLSVTAQSCKTDTTDFPDSTAGDYGDDVCPYATFQISKPYGEEGSFSGNVYSGPYHPAGAAFFYHNTKRKPDKRTHGGYSKVCAKSGTKFVNNESHESDNFGSTDSEVKKILSLHLPISEYDNDTRESDSEDAPRRTKLKSFPSFRGKNLKSTKEESSSSSETTPTTDGRKNFARKKGFIGKRGGKNYSVSATEETAFGPKTKQSPYEGQSRGISDIESEMRRVRSRSNQQDTFQIDV